MTATITVAVGWTSERPVIPDQYVSYVTVPLVDLSEPGPWWNSDIRHHERHAMLEAFGSVAGRTNPGRWPACVMVTSLNIVKETL